MLLLILNEIIIHVMESKSRKQLYLSHMFTKFLYDGNDVDNNNDGDNDIKNIKNVNLQNFYEDYKLPRGHTLSSAI